MACGESTGRRIYMQLGNRHDDGMVSEDEQLGESESQTDEHAPLISEKKSQSSKTRPVLDPPPQPSPFKRLALVLLLLFLFWVGLKVHTALVLSKKPKVVHASRYSKEFKFRPAASPIITETLKDGRVRLRGAVAEPTLPPTPPNTRPKMKGNKKRKRKAGGGKRKHGKSR